MKALSLAAPGSATIVDTAGPHNPAGSLLLKTEFIGLCGSDLNSFRGKNPLVSYPRILGHEVSATVVEGTAHIPSGTHVTLSPYTACGRCSSCRCGRANACRYNETLGVQRDGAAAQWLSIPEDKVYPSTLPLRDLCLVEPLTVGFHAAHRGRITAQDTVAVFGCGGIGLGAIAGASFRGARVIAIDIDDDKLETARQAGASDLVNTRHIDLHAHLQQLTDGHGPDVIIEAIGLPSTFTAAIEEVAFTGRVVYIGYAKDHVVYDTRLFVQKELDILGSRNALPQDFHDVIAMLEASRFPVDAAISAIVPLEEGPAILSRWSEDPTRFTKIMIQLSA